MSEPTPTAVLSKFKELRAVRSAAALLVAALAASAPAQTAPPAPTPAAATTTTTTQVTVTTPAPPASSSTSSDVTALEKYTVSDTPLEEQILPTVRPISSVLGDGMDIIDIPRSVSTVNKAWMDDRQVKNAMDFGQFSPGVYSPASYGIPATPQIRGDYAQIYIDGQETLFTHNEVYPSFNGIEAMDIVKGPGSAVYGPQGEGPGGYVNLVTKEPYFDAQHTDISATLGYWTSGHSYSNPSLTIDTGGPLSSSLAYRISYLSQYGDGYYLYTKNTTQDLYAALTYLANSKVKVEWWGQYYWSRFNEVAGVNRVTQNFIWNGDYIAGPATGLRGDLRPPQPGHGLHDQAGGRRHGGGPLRQQPRAALPVAACRHGCGLLGADDHQPHVFREHGRRPVRGVRLQ
jgi:outer membrane receptor for ferric coprogen and ferric-rhodotorulic acid